VEVVEAAADDVAVGVEAGASLAAGDGAEEEEEDADSRDDVSTADAAGLDAPPHATNTSSDVTATLRIKEPPVERARLPFDAAESSPDGADRGQALRERDRERRRG
jgi:hypothetical protein